MNDACDDERLAAEIAGGSLSALAQVYRAHAGRVFSLARRILEDGGMAEKVVEEVFVRLWEEAELFDHHQGSLRAHLLCLARTRSHELLGPRSGVDVAPTGADITARLMLPGLDVLPDEEIQAIELTYFGGYSSRQVAELLHVPEHTVRSRIRHGLKRLRLATSDEGDG